MFCLDKEVETDTIVKQAIDSLENPSKRLPEMIHSSQKPVDKPPLTKGYTVDRMVKRLSYDNSSPPPKTNVMITPNVNVQHNNNRPFSYTRGLSPETERNPNSPVIYAQVVCEQNGGHKQTIHTAYTNGKKHLPHSDSDEGLGYEETTITGFGGRNKNIIRFGDDRDFYNEEYPITPNYKNVEYNGFKSYDDDFKTEHNIFIDSSSRGRGDGMDAKRRESLTENFDNLNLLTPKQQQQHYQTTRNDLSLRRDQLESRLNRRFRDKSPTELRNGNVRETVTTKYYRSGSTSPIGFRERHVTETVIRDGKEYTSESHTKKYYGDDDYRRNNYRYDNNEPKSFDSFTDYRSSPEQTSQQDYHRTTYVNTNNKYKAKATFKNKDHHKSNPEITTIRDYDYDKYRDSYHDSLKRDKLSSINRRYYDQNDQERKDKFGDSGIENDFRRDSADNYLTNKKKRDREFVINNNNESEDEGFASSLLIASERQHTDDNAINNNNNRKQRREYEYENKSYHNKDDNNDYFNYNNDNDNRIDYKIKYKTKDRNEYAPRERSIDDGSHFDPRIDKDYDRGTLKKINDKKPPKPEKKSSLEKVSFQKIQFRFKAFTCRNLFVSPCATRLFEKIQRSFKLRGKVAKFYP